MYVWGTITRSGSEVQAVERRALRRLKVTLNISVLRLNQGRYIQLTTEDVSTGGLRFRSRTALAVGETLDICIPLESNGLPVYVVGKVVWCRPSQDSRLGSYEGGIMFTRVSERTRERLSRFLDTIEATQQESVSQPPA